MDDCSLILNLCSGLKVRYCEVLSVQWVGKNSGQFCELWFVRVENPLGFRLTYDRIDVVGRENTHRVCMSFPGQ